MRIIGGKEKGRRLYTLSGLSVRPTSDRIREALFNILPIMSGMKLLDLFAGTGSIGIEALSRDAKRVVFVENKSVLIKLIERNLNECFFSGNYELLHMPTGKALHFLARREECFDYIFMDPPYDRAFVHGTIENIASSSILSKNGVIIIQHSQRELIELRKANFILEKENKYGDTLLSFIKFNSKDMVYE